MPLDAFHPAISQWFERDLGAPTEVQARAWPAVSGNRLLYRDGVPEAVLQNGEVHLLETLPSGAAWEVQQMLRRGPGQQKPPTPEVPGAANFLR